jgi:hypothetical protein
LRRYIPEENVGCCTFEKCITWSTSVCIVVNLKEEEGEDTEHINGGDDNNENEEKHENVA